MQTTNPYIKLAKLLVQYSIGVQNGDLIIVHGTTTSTQLLKEVYREVLKQGAHPWVRIDFEDQEFLFYDTADDHQIDFLHPFDMHVFEKADGLIRVFPDQNPHALSAIDPEKKQRQMLAQMPIYEVVFRRMEEDNYRWVATASPSSALAQEAKMSLEEYTDFVFKSMHLDQDDPVAFWRQRSEMQEKLCQRLNQVKEIRFKGEDTDLHFRCEGRKWLNCDGKLNFPDGEVATSPIEDSVEGTIRFTYPGIFRGEEIENIFLKFEKGKVVEANAAKGDKLLQTLLDSDEGARFVGEAAIGTNDNITRFTKNMLFDEKMGGTIHLALGKSLPFTGGTNESAMHWDMLKDMKTGGEIYADGNLIYRDGKFID